MFEVLLPNGSLEEVCTIGTVCEKFVEMEESRKRVWAGTKDISSANGIMVDLGMERYFIGNLENGRIRGIMTQTLKEGRLDCTSLGLDVVPGVSEIKEGIPYIQKSDVNGNDSFSI